MRDDSNKYINWNKQRGCYVKCRYFVIAVLCITSICLAGQVADIDFVNVKNKINGDTLTFSRNSIAYNLDGTTVASNIIRKAAVSVSSPTEKYNYQNYRVIACSSDYIYAAQGANLYRARCSQYPVWQLLYSFAAGINTAFVTSKDTLLISLGVASGQSAGTIWRWNGQNMTQVMDHTVMVAGASATSFSWSEVNGRIFVGEYRSSMSTNNARRIWLSDDDGLTWTRIYGPASDSTSGNVTGQHEHAIVGCIVDGIYKCYVCFGDDTAKAMYCLTDNGTSTWDVTQITLRTVIQPTGGLWIPERNSIVWGTDGATSVGLVEMNLDTHVFSYAIHLDVPLAGSDTYEELYNFLSVRKFNGVYFAAATHSSGNYKHTGIWTSPDSLNWTRFITIPDLTSTGEIRIAGISNRNILWTGYNVTSSNYGSVSCNIPNSYVLSGAVIERAGSQSFNNVPRVSTGNGSLVVKWEASKDYSLGNFVYPSTYNGYYYEVTTDNGSSGSSEPTWPTVVDTTATDGGITWTCRLDSWTSADLWDGTPDLRWFGTATSDATCSLHGVSSENIPNLTAGDLVYLSFYIKGLIGDGTGGKRGTGGLGKVRVYLNIKKNDDSLSTDEWTSVFLSETTKDWQRVVLPVVTQNTIASNAVASAVIYITASSTPYNAQYDLIVDGITIEKAIVPAEYHLASVPRNADVLSYTPSSFPVAFTDIFTFVTRFGEWEIAANTSGDGISYIYLRSYAVDSDDFIAVVYDVTDKKFKLINESGGTNTVVASSSASYIYRYEPITIAVIRSGTIATVSIWHAGAYQTISGTITNHSFATSYWGSHPSGTQGGSLIFVRDVMYNEVLDDVQGYMVWPSQFTERTIKGSAGWLSF